MQAKVAELEKELKKQTEYKEMYQRRESEATSQIDELHDFLDGLPDVLPKDKGNYSINKVQTRLLSWIAKKAVI